MYRCPFCRGPVGAADTRCGQCGTMLRGMTCARCGFTELREAFRAGCPRCRERDQRRDRWRARLLAPVRWVRDRLRR